jgi:glycerophosphoryl diester phosphodiesterase
MCFDANLLNELHSTLPDYRYVYLTYQPIKSINSFLSEVDFKPYALGMYHITVRKKDISLANEMDVKIFAWTVNNHKQCNKLIRYGVEGIITDYPDRIRDED